MLRADRLVALRKEKGLIQQDVANYLNITRPAYVQYEKGYSQPTNESIVKLADFFNVSTDYILGRSDHYTHPDDPNLEAYPKEEGKIEKAPPVIFTEEAFRKIVEDEAGRPLTHEELILLRARIRDLRATVDEITNKND